MPPEHRHLTPKEMFEVWPEIWRTEESTTDLAVTSQDTLSATLGDVALSDEIDYALILKPILEETPSILGGRHVRRYLELGQLKLHRALLPLAAVATGVIFAYIGQSEAPAHADKTPQSTIKPEPTPTASGKADQSTGTSSTSRPKPSPSNIPDFNATNKTPTRSTPNWVPAGASSNLPKTSSTQATMPPDSPSPSWPVPSGSPTPSWPAPSQSPGTPNSENTPTPSEDAGTSPSMSPPESSTPAQPSESLAESTSPSGNTVAATPRTP